MNWPNNFVNKSVQIGYNDGYTKNFFSVNNSFTLDIKNVQKTSNVMIPGKWIFRVDEPEIKQPDNFLSFGMLAHDHMMEKSDDGHTDPIPASHIEFLGISIDCIFVYTNGFITLNEPLKVGRQLPDQEHNLKANRFKSNNLIAPLWTDVDTVNGGNVYYRHVLDTKSLRQISNEINEYHTLDAGNK